MKKITTLITTIILIVVITSCKGKGETATTPVEGATFTIDSDLNIYGKWIHEITAASDDLWKVGPPEMIITEDSNMVIMFYEVGYSGKFIQTGTYELVFTADTGSGEGEEWPINEKANLVYNPKTEQLHYSDDNYNLKFRKITDHEINIISAFPAKEVELLTYEKNSFYTPQRQRTIITTQYYQILKMCGQMKTQKRLNLTVKAVMPD